MVLTVRPHSAVERTNLDLAEHSTLRGGGWDSGLLAVGERYKIKLASEDYSSTRGRAKPVQSWRRCGEPERCPHGQSALSACGYTVDPPLDS